MEEFLCAIRAFQSELQKVKGEVPEDLHTRITASVRTLSAPRFSVLVKEFLVRSPVTASPTDLLWALGDLVAQLGMVNLREEEEEEGIAVKSKSVPVRDVVVTLGILCLVMVVSVFTHSALQRWLA